MATKSAKDLVKKASCEVETLTSEHAFTQPVENARFMYHCHILEHEDNGLMGQFATS